MSGLPIGRQITLRNVIFMIKWLIQKYIKRNRFIMDQTEVIFTPGTIPNLTYNSRESEQLEKMVNYKLQVRGKIVILSGPSKIGKTVLINKVLDQDKVVKIQGDELTNESDLIIQILKKLSKLPVEKKTIETLNASADLNVEANSKLSFWAAIGFKIGIKGNLDIQKSTQNTFIDDPFERAIEYMIKEGYVLVIDDFHYINGDLQKRVIRKLKEPLSQGLRVLIALIPSRTEVIVEKEPDMEFRTSVIDVPLWSKEELEYIPRTGFNALGIELEQRIIDDLVSNSFSNPFLMQELCSQLMFEYDIITPVEGRTKICFDDEKMRGIYKSVSKHDSVIQQLELGQTKRGQDRASYQVTVSELETKVVDLYKIIMMSLGALANQDKISVDDIMDTIDAMEIQKVGSGKVKLRTSDVTATLKKISTMASKINLNDPVIEYKEIEKTVYMYDSFFSFNLRFHYELIFG